MTLDDWRLQPEERLLATAVDDAPLGQIIGRELDGDLVAREDADVVLAHLSGDVRGDHMSVFQLDSESRVGQGLDDLAIHLNRFFFSHKLQLGILGAELCRAGTPMSSCAASLYFSHWLGYRGAKT